jgi:hypothetical protein
VLVGVSLSAILGPHRSTLIFAGATVVLLVVVFPFVGIGAFGFADLLRRAIGKDVQHFEPAQLIIVYAIAVAVPVLVAYTIGVVLPAIFRTQ